MFNWPSSDDLVTFEHVTVLRATDLLVTCQVDGKTVPIGRAMIEPASSILDGGAQDGTLILARWRAHELGLLDG